MNRKEFLQSFIKSGLLLSVPVDFFSKGKKYDAVQIYTSYVAGFKFYNGVMLSGEMSANDALDLIHETGNKHDDNAMALFWNTQKIGYLPMKDNELYCRMINAGVPVYCDIVQLDTAATTWKMCKVGVYLLYPENYLQKKPASLNVEKKHVVKVISI
jgi:hypothetical protein